MLILGREPGEKVFIGPPSNPRMIEIEVVRLSPNAAKIGFTAPPEYEIHREEVLQRIEAEGDPS